MIALAPGRLPMGGAALSPPFPFFALYCKLQCANKRLYYGAEANTGARRRRAWRIGPGASEEREERNLIDDVARTEAIEADLDRLIERRAKHNEKANAEAAAERMAAASRARRYREAVLWQRLDYHRQQLDSHTRTFSRLLERHKGALRLVEAELGITTNEGENAA